MQRFFLFFLLVIATTAFSQAPKTEIIKFPRLEKMIRTPGPEIKVFNFWATWCAPCVKELPLFEAVHNKNDKNVEITLISLDFSDKVSRVDSFVERKKMKLRTYLLDEIDYNAWIDKIDPQWSGSIPATLIINSKTGQRKFIEKELEEGELEKLIEELQKS